MTKNKAAFFDIDGTFYRDSLLIEHFKRLIKYEIISPSVWHDQVIHTFQDWDKRQGNYDVYLLDVSKIYVEHLTNVSKEDIEFIAKQVIRLKADRVYKYTRQQINWHLENDYKVIFISGSPDFLVAKMAEKYHATDYCGSTYHIDDNGFFTGEVQPMWDSVSKERTIKEMVEKHQIDLTQSYAYGDTNGDLTMFKHVGNPIAINPAKELLTAISEDKSLREKTQIVIERKDVIYSIDPKSKTVTFD
ncbi:HAD superfamily hydrolase (TIGR01490 family) [Salirhabdus euzebyi]|uniref:phosphoserine phosphatase n=1 Tax=Salirhabdus euzebyi TaxID=394506 RepID=A0A841PZF4_9BACI|nr:HAD-IB family hydrolase [Salirhabdus euzebyi]MBB6452761.1 HAD superfamily hydrolase (TIGR01490 family) [Salirhabdus euzebyi]